MTLKGTLVHIEEESRNSAVFSLCAVWKLKKVAKRIVARKLGVFNWRRNPHDGEYVERSKFEGEEFWNLKSKILAIRRRKAWRKAQVNKKKRIEYGFCLEELTMNFRLDMTMAKRMVDRIYFY